MTETNFRAFHEEHKHKIGSEYRLEVLKMSKEDIYDYLDCKHSDNCFEWLRRTVKLDSQVKSLTDKSDALQKELDELKQVDNGLASEYIKKIAEDKNNSVLKLIKANELIDRIEHWIKNTVPTKLINIKPTKNAIKEYKNEK